jgi:hypothetical protein
MVASERNMMAKGKLALVVIGCVVGTALSYRAALLAEGIAFYGGWRTPGLIVFFHLLPLINRGSEPPLWLFRVPIGLTC